MLDAKMNPGLTGDFLSQTETGMGLRLFKVPTLDRVSEDASSRCLALMPGLLLPTGHDATFPKREPSREYHER